MKEFVGYRNGEWVPVSEILPVPGERVLTLRLSRRDAESNLTYALFHLVLIPPRYHAVLVSESHGRILGVWATSKDRRAPAHGTPYEAPATPVGGLVPGRDTPEVFFDRLRAQDRAVKDAVRTILSGADRHLVARICTDSDVCPTTHTDSVTELVSAAMWSTAQHLWSIGGGPVYRWTRGQTRISIVAPDSQMEALQFPSVCAALADAGETAADAAADMNGQRRRLEYVRRVLERRAADLQKDLDEKINKVLTEDQRKLYAAYRQEQAQNRGRWRRRGYGDEHGGDGDENDGEQ